MLSKYLNLKQTCKAPEPLSNVGEPPPSNNTADSAICAFFNAVIVFVIPKYLIFLIYF